MYDHTKVFSAPLHPLIYISTSITGRSMGVEAELPHLLQRIVGQDRIQQVRDCMEP